MNHHSFRKYLLCVLEGVGDVKIHKMLSLFLKSCFHGPLRDTDWGSTFAVLHDTALKWNYAFRSPYEALT